jgi:hypothetical protein
MAATVDVFGKKLPVWGVGLVGAGGVAAVYWAVKQKKAAAAVSSANTGIDPVTGLPYSEDNTVDPITGETYLSEAQQYGSVSAAEAAYTASVAGTSSSPLSGGQVASGDYYGTSTGTLGNGTVVPGTTYGSNSAWAQAVEAGLTDLGYSSTDVSAALGRYLANLSETTAQATIVQAALAEYGEPPVGSYQIITAPSSTATGTTTNVVIPNVEGLLVVQAEQILEAAGLKGQGPPGVVNVLHIVTSTNPAIGTTVPSGSTVALNYKSQSESSPKPAAVTVTVPNVVGKDVTQASAACQAAGLLLRPEVPAVHNVVHTVTSQSPKAGSKAVKGSTVTITYKSS